MVYVVILNLIFLIILWINGWLAIRAGEISIAISLSFIIFLQMILGFILVNRLKNEKR